LYFIQSIQFKTIKPNSSTSVLAQVNFKVMQINLMQFGLTGWALHGKAEYQSMV